MSSFGCLVLNLFSASVSLCLYDVILPCTDSLQYLFLSLCRCMFCELAFGHSEITLGAGERIKREEERWTMAHGSRGIGIGQMALLFLGQLVRERIMAKRRKQPYWWEPGIGGSQNKKEEHIISLNADLNWIHLLMSPWPPKSHQDYESTDGLTYPWSQHIHDPFITSNRPCLRTWLLRCLGMKSSS